MSEFRDKTIVITGASRGLGRELALRLGQAGAQVVVNYARSEAAAAEVAGAIVNISAVTAIAGRRNAANYCASKAGMNMLTQCAALELGPGVRVNGLALGFYRSELVEEVFSAETIESVVQQTPLRRLGEFTDVCSAVEFLASDASSFITGQTIIIDGGRLMR